MAASETRAWLNHYAEWTPHEVEYEGKTLLDAYDHTIATYGDRPATYFFGRTQTYNEVDRQVRAAAAGLRAFGIRPGDRVAILLPNCPQHVIAFWAVLKLGAVVTEHNPLYTAHELEGPFKNHGARIAICWDKATPLAEELRHTTDLETIISVNMTEAMPGLMRFALKLPVPQLRKTREKLTGAAPNTIPWEALTGAAFGGEGEDVTTPQSLTPDSPALILYTSGTTGKPKGAELSHENLYAQVMQGVAWVPGLDENSNERVLAALPIFHAYGLTFNVTLAMAVAAEVVLLPTPDLKLIMGIMKKRPPTFLPGVPTLYDRIIEAAQENDISLTSIRNAFSGASSLPSRTIERWEQLTSGRLVEGYGLTETSPVIVGNPMDGNRRPGYIGLPFPNTLVRIANPDNLAETMPDGQEGELLVKGPQVFHGYLDRPDANEQAFYDGWFRTGDVGLMEEDGFIRLVARIKEVIITGGFNVYPGEVEEVLASHPDVADCSVVGLPREDGSETVTAAITLAEGAKLDTDGIKDYCRKMLTRYKVPRAFYHFEEMPGDQLGKVRRREVQAALLERLQEKR